MAHEGRCYCGAVRYEISSDPAFNGILKRGTLDNPAAFGNPQFAIFTCDQQPFHRIPENLQAFARAPGSAAT